MPLGLSCLYMFLWVKPFVQGIDLFDRIFVENFQQDFAGHVHCDFQLFWSLILCE